MSSVKFSNTPWFSNWVNAYEDGHLNDAFVYTSSEDSLVKAIANQKFSNESRLLLVETLKKQQLRFTAKQNENLALLLQPDNYTVTTGQQLGLLGGPYLTLIKAIQCIKICDDWNQKNSKNKLVPIFWMASEDHDLVEVNTFDTLQQHYALNTEDQHCAVGRLALPDDFQSLLDAVSGSFQHNAYWNAYVDAVQNARNWSDQFRAFLQSVLGDKGLIILDPDQDILKKEFIPVLKNELLNQVTYSAVNSRNEWVKAKGFEPQVHVRPINLFFISNSGERTRITYEEINNTKIWNVVDEKLNEKELLRLLDMHPEAFSPNALLRPMYQQSILPNVLYVGGAAELQYWSQITTLFPILSIPAPVLTLRDSIIVIDKKANSKLQKLALSPLDLIKPKQRLELELLGTINEAIPAFEALKVKLEEAFDGVKTIIQNTDTTLLATIAAEITKAQKSSDIILQKLTKAIKIKEEIKLNQLNSLFDTLFPNNKLQERNVSSFAIVDDMGKLVNITYDCIVPFEPRVHILPYE